MLSSGSVGEGSGVWHACMYVRARGFEGQLLLQYIVFKVRKEESEEI